MPTIAEATKGGAADHGNHFWDLQLDDGRKAWMLAKHDVNVGEEVVEAYEKDGKLRVKRPEKDVGGNGGGGKSYEADPKKIRREAYGSALHAAVALVAATNNTNVKSTDVVRVADEFYEATMAKVGE